MASIRSVNVGRPREVEGVGRTSIDKHAVTGPVQVHELGVEGDQVSHTRFHGGPDMAVYAFAREDLDVWAERLQAEILDGQFGENLTTEGLDVNAAEMGERWRVGEVLFEVVGFRTPCNVFKAWMSRSGFDATAWVKRFAEESRPGPYLRVLQPGVLQAGDAIEVVHVPGTGITVTTAFRDAMGFSA